MTETLEKTDPKTEPQGRDDDEPYLVVEDLTVQFPTYDGLVQAVTELSYTRQAWPDARNRR